MALLTAAQARLHLPGLTGTGEDTAIGTIIDRVEALIAVFIGHPPASVGGTPTVESTTYTLYTDRGAAPIRIDGDDLVLPVRPLTAVSAVYDDDQRSYGTAVSSADYEVLGDEGRIRLLPTRSHAGWSSDIAAIKVACTAGWSTAPDWLAHAVALWMRHIWDLRREQGRESTSQQGVSVSFRDETMPDVVRESLAPHVVMLTP